MKFQTIKLSENVQVCGNQTNTVRSGSGVSLVGKLNALGQPVVTVSYTNHGKDESIDISWGYVVSSVPLTDAPTVREVANPPSDPEPAHVAKSPAPSLAPPPRGKR